jgi:3-oxoacyl-[acyl-carrier-protein] synthase III
MAKFFASGVEIKGIQTCVPRQSHKNAGELFSLSSGEVEKISRMAGIRERHIAVDNVCTSDLCVEAAGRLIERLNWRRETIELLVFITQTPDYFMPSSSCVIQNKLALSNNCAAFDVNLGCSAYPYGLGVVSKMMQGEGVRKALLLIGETPSKVCHPSDRSTSMIFGDVGSATALEVSPSAPGFYCILQTDGNGAKDFMVPAGAFRDRFNGDDRTHYITMNGPAIFAFTMRAVPSLLEDVLQYADWIKEKVDYFVLHQANLFIIEHLRKKMNLPPEKVPVVIDRYGNTGGGSIALVMTQANFERPPGNPLQLVLLGFGVGLSWGGAAVQLAPHCMLGHSEL